MKRLSLLVGTVAAITTAPQALAQGECGATMAEYHALQTGMSYSQVVRIIGCPGEEISRVDMAGYTTIMYMWPGEGMFNLGANMNVMLQNDELVSKAQFGLK